MLLPWRWVTPALSLTALVLLAAGCPEPPPPAASTPAATTAAPADAPLDIPTTPGTATAPATETEPAISESGDPATTLLGAEEGTEYELRFRLTHAEFNAEKDADLSRLHFELRGGGDGADVTKKLTLTDRDTPVGETFKLNFGGVKVQPLISKPKETGSGNSDVEVTTWGGYRITLFTKAGKKIGEFDMIDGEGPSQSDIKEEAGFAIIRVPNRKGLANWRYEVYDRPAKEVGGATALFVIEPSGVGVDGRRVNDPDGNVWEYKFPYVRLKIYPGSGLESRRGTVEKRNPDRDRE
jgi:hypothetical protein